jgi:predicted DNA-binding transcriptional regulator AlpA
MKTCTGAGLIEDLAMNAAPMPALLLSAPDAARVLALSRSALYDGVSSGRIVPPVRIGGRVLWRAAELEAWVSAGCPPVAKWKAGASPLTNAQS